MPIIIDYKKCCWQDGKCQSCKCGGAGVGCVEACPVGAISRKKVVTIDKELCLECGVCISACKHGALAMD